MYRVISNNFRESESPAINGRVREGLTGRQTATERKTLYITQTNVKGNR